MRHCYAGCCKKYKNRNQIYSGGKRERSRSCIVSRVLSDCLCRCEELLPVHEIENHPEFIKWCENALTEDEPHFVQITKLAAELNIGVVITGFSKGKKYPQNTSEILQILNTYDIY